MFNDSSGRGGGRPVEKNTIFLKITSVCDIVGLKAAVSSTGSSLAVQIRFCP